MFGDHIIMALAGLGGGLVLGIAARRGRFCTLGAIEDALYAGDFRRLRMWALALAVSIAGVFGLGAIGQVDIGASIYATQAWDPVASIVGGLLFGYGMAMAGNCGYGALARLGGGDLRSLVIVMVIGISAFAAISGPLAAVRVALFPVEPAASLDGYGVAHSGGAVLGVAPVWVAFAGRRRFRGPGPCGGRVQVLAAPGGLECRSRSGNRLRVVGDLPDCR